MRKRVLLPLIAIVLVLGLAATALADTIRLKDGSVIKGKVVGFKDQQFTVLIGNAARGRQSRLTIYIDDIESIEFDGSTGVAYNNDDDRPASSNPPVSTPPRPSNTGSSTGSTRPSNPPPASGNSTAGGNGAFFPIKVRVTGDNTTNGWTSTGFVVRRGQRLRISATGSAETYLWTCTAMPSRRT